MKSEGILKHLFLAFVVAVVGYALIYALVEHQRTKRGPWIVTFTNAASGQPLLLVNQTSLSISNVQLRFAMAEFMQARAGAQRVFSNPQPVPFELPFGKCVFMDTTFLPGTVAMEVLGHEIELLPRVLVVDRREHRWVSGMTVDLEARPGGRLTNLKSVESSEKSMVNTNL